MDHGREPVGVCVVKPKSVGRLGRYGVRSGGLRVEDPARGGELTETAVELEKLGFGASWLGGSTGVRHAAPLVAATPRITLATGIQNIRQHGAAGTAVHFAEPEATHPGSG